MPKNYTIREYGYIWCGEGSSTLDNLFLPADTFELLENWILESEQELLMSFGKKNGKSFLKAKNYVGVVELRNGTQIEILPKIAEEANIAVTQRVLLKMLHYLDSIPFKYNQKAQIGIEKISVFEIFIMSFLEELKNLFQKGLKLDYQEIEENQAFLKGKIKFKEQLQKNALHKERFFIIYDEYVADIAPNRIIKTTLLFLEKATRNHQNRQKIKNFHHFLTDIPASKNLKQDLEACKHLNRFFSHYKTVLEWCEIFLQNRSFTNFSGNYTNWAMLFPMEKVFESYIGKMFHKYAPQRYHVTLQDKKHYLLETPEQFRLIPDMVVSEGNKTVCIIDTKWKRLDFTQQNLGILQADLYQMFTYAKKYDAGKLLLIYPETEGKQPQTIHWKYDTSLNIDIVLFPMYELYLFNSDFEKTFVEKLLGN
ncbi:MAG: McrC family protein [Raineya sp.]|jgi:5-methylcytosine-specific restriction enzyme subunit McrC|nr:McrC family protein [Raineya sp.]